jgi:hypothetical protein
MVKRKAKSHTTNSLINPSHKNITKKFNDDLSEKILNLRDEAGWVTLDWLKKKSGSIETDVIAYLEKRHKELIIRMLGFNIDKWSDKIEIDYCNGRSGQTTAGQAFIAANKEAVDKWMKELTKLPRLTKPEKERVKKEYKESLLSALRRAAYEHGEINGNRYMGEIIDEVTASSAILAKLDKEEKEKKEEKKRMESERTALQAEQANLVMERKKLENLKSQFDLEVAARIKLKEEAKQREETPRILSSEL